MIFLIINKTDYIANLKFSLVINTYISINKLLLYFFKITKKTDFLANEINGGESGIRTHGTCEGTHTFQACALNHSATSPLIIFLKLYNIFLKDIILK